MEQLYTEEADSSIPSNTVILDNIVSEYQNRSLFYPTDALRECLLDFAPEHHWDAIGHTVTVNSFTNHRHLYLDRPLSRTPFLNQFFENTRNALSEGQYFAFTVVTAENIKFIFKNKYPSLLFKIYYPFHFFGRRVCPKLKGFRKISRKLGIKADMSKSEIMGRLIYHGFQIAQIREDIENTIFVIQRHPTSNPSSSLPPSKEGFLFSMRRVGKNEKPVTIYKLRSMHPYSEFVQAYLHETNGLDDGGKFKNDFRVSTGGKLIRKYWIDELPMLYNLLKGDIKLIGVRPISEHYLSLYPEPLKAIRNKHKPGLLPPFYADLPKSFQEILVSEQKYLESYEKAPLKTDWSYFWRIITNIIIHKARSK
jgi:hypothetical protein